MKAVLALLVGLMVGSAIFVWPKISHEGHETSAIQSLPTIPTSMSVGGAYSAIPHRRTPLAASRLEVDAPERDYLKKVFSAIDRAVLLRVATLRAFQNGNFDDKYLKSYDSLESYVRGLQPPRRLKSYHACIERSLGKQEQFFRYWHGRGESFSGRSSDVNGHSAVKSASKSLQKAYRILMKEYPDASETNKRAFFDYHCAFDFI